MEKTGVLDLVEVLEDEECFKKYVQGLFQLFDADKSNKLEENELYDAIVRLSKMTGGDPPTRYPMRQYMRKYDTDRSGDLSLAEFAQMAKELLCEDNFVMLLKEDARFEELIARLFKQYDKDRSGALDFKELVNLVTCFAQRTRLGGFDNAEEVAQHLQRYGVLSTDASSSMTLKQFVPFCRDLFQLQYQRKLLNPNDLSFVSFARQMYEDADKDKSGTVELEELRALVVKMFERLSLQPPLTKDIVAMFTKYNQQQLGDENKKALTFEEFLPLSRELYTTAMASKV